ncbi:MAG: aminopeptidase P family protein [Hyphomicrobiales bacterium]
MSDDFAGHHDRKDRKERLEQLRAALVGAGVDGFIIPHADEYQGECLAPCAERLRWVTGFSGSAGVAVVLTDAAALFVDGRYTIQARQQVDREFFTLYDIIEHPPAGWCEAHLGPGWKLAYDPWLHTGVQVKDLKAACEAVGARFVALERNPVDELWHDRPAPPSAMAMPHPVEFAGQSAAEKMAMLSQSLEKAKADAAVLTLSDSIAWAFNIRGVDIAHIPVVLSYAIIRREGRPTLFIAPEKLRKEVRFHLEPFADLATPNRFEADLKALGGRKARVLVDSTFTPARVEELLANAGAGIVAGRDPCLLPKARKNSVEIEGARRAHLRDGEAMARFLAWLDREAPSGGVDEISAAERLKSLREQSGELVDVSFATISASGPHAAMPHYQASPASNRPLKSGEIYLIDSGGQYRDATTDITRTLIIGGQATPPMRDRFTRVLKGHIALSMARFPAGTSGAQLDCLARIALWRAGLDFNHGAGHGVGSFLSVHEGPARIAKTGHVPLEPGMILSNEPGYYAEGQYGIRIENLLLVGEAEAIQGGDAKMHGFEMLSFTPIDLRLVEPSLLDPREVDWLNDYHAEVRRRIAPRLDGDALAWLESTTEPLAP